MKRILFVGFWLLFGIIQSEIVFAYEILTHQDMSQKSLEFSVLASPSSVLGDLQLKAFDDKSQKFPGADEGEKTILELLRYGANQEDNLYIPGVGGSRFMHHFYDPVHNLPLTDFNAVDLEVTSLRYGVPYQPIQKSPTWTLEDNGDFLDNKYAGQIFSYKDARGYFFKALTEFSKTERDKYFGLTFQTLGHVIHHIQDMAQPQHVKNEQHPPIAPSGLYEHYTNEDKVRARLPFTGYAPVDSLAADQKTFDTPRKFWSTSNGTGKGLAEFTNFNFVTYGHNFTGTLAQPQPDPVYPNPTPIAFREPTVIDLPLAPQAGLDQAALSGKMYFIKSAVADAYRPSEARINNLASAFSLYDDDLTRWNIHLDCPPGSIIDPSIQCTQQAVFTVNRFTMSAAHNFLIPRAVSYSAGMINYFFRGKLSVDDQIQPGRLVVKNDGSETLSGHFTLYYDAAEGNRYAVVPDPVNSLAAAPWPTPTEGLLPGQTLILPTFAPPPTDLRPAPKTPGEYMLVFRGTMGQEQDIAVAAKAVTVQSTQAFLTPQGSITFSQGTWQFQPMPNLRYGTHYWRGKEGKNLSWDDTTIYRGGQELFAVPAGATIRGAARRTVQTASGEEHYIVTILTFSNFLIHEFWERREESPGEWTRRAQFDGGPLFADVDIMDWYNELNLMYWVFNDSGTEAVTLFPSAAEPPTATFTPSAALLQLQTTSGQFVYLGSAVSSGLPIVAVDYDGEALVKVLSEIEESSTGVKWSLVFEPSMARLDMVEYGYGGGFVRGVLLCGWDWGKRIVVVAKYNWEYGAETGPLEVTVWDKGQFTASFPLDMSAQLPPLNFNELTLTSYRADWSGSFAVDTNGHILVSLNIAHNDTDGEPITDQPVNVLYAPEEQKLDTALPAFLNTTASPVGPVGLR